jgi:3-phenylpropionate/trans-cinnamate dioxygenase ferredoxin reductase component
LLFLCVILLPVKCDGQESVSIQFHCSWKEYDSQVTSYKHLVLGGGMVAGYLAKEYVDNGGSSGDLAIVSADDVVPYERPPLSKGFLAGKDSEESVLISPPDFYEKHGIHIRRDTTITSLDPERKRLRTAAGEEFAFEKLVFATGAQVRTLDVPGASPRNVLYLRSFADSRRIRERAADAKRAVVVGGGFIAMEVTSVLAGRGIETAMLIRDDRMGKAIFTPEMSAFFAKYYAGRNVRVRTHTAVAAIENGSAARLNTSDTIPFDLLVAGIGVQPVTDLAARAGLKIDNGVLVNEFLETEHPDILAAGDVANYPDAIFDNKRRRTEHWDNAVSQGQHAARALLGRREPFLHVPYFFSDVFDLSYEFWGDTSGADGIAHRGDLDTSSFSVWWLRGGRLVAAFTMNRPDEERELAPEWIRSKRTVSAERLRDAHSLHEVD